MTLEAHEPVARASAAKETTSKGPASKETTAKGPTAKETTPKGPAAKAPMSKGKNRRSLPPAHDEDNFEMRTPAPSVNYTVQITERFMRGLKANGVTAVMQHMKG